jgi:hypothetical protein
METIQQLGGFGKLKMMVGAYNFSKDNNSLTFKFKGSKKMNICKITLNSLDLYNVEFKLLRAYNLKTVEVHNDIYCDQLIEIFERTTGLSLRLF